jgi:hypothetical protein
MSARSIHLSRRRVASERTKIWSCGCPSPILSRRGFGTSRQITRKDSAGDANLLADLAGLALQAFRQTEILTALTPDQVKATRDKIAVKFPGPSSQLTSLQRFLKWSVSGARTRTISPFSDLTVADWVKNRIQEGTLDDLRVAISWIRRTRVWSHISVWRSPILLSEKKEMQTMPDERGQKLIIRPTGPSSSLQTTMK